MRGQSGNGLVYTQKTGAQDLYKMMKAVGIPVIVFLASLVCITIMGIFGRKLVAPCVALMWASGAVVAIVFPNHRRSSIAEAYTFILVYVSSLLVLRMLLSWMSGISTESLAASFDQPVSIVTGNSAIGILNTAIWTIAVMTPFGYIGMQVKKIFQFKRQQSAAKAMDTIRGRMATKNRVDR